MMDEIRRRLILDFDGMITDIGEETKSFQGMYPYILCDKLNLNREKYILRFKEIKKDLKNNEIEGFFINGKNVMPASCDPYILTQSTGQQLIKELKLKIKDEDKLLVDLFLETRAEVGKKETFYRKGKERTREFFDKILNKYEVCFVTNASPDKVEKHLKELGEEYFERINIYANAKKLFVDDDYKEIPKSICSGGFSSPREVLLRRKEYHKILKDLKNKKGFYPSITTVIGDIYELDLALPDYLGYNIIQIENGYSQKHERDYLGERFVKDYNELEKLLL